MRSLKTLWRSRLPAALAAFLLAVAPAAGDETDEFEEAPAAAPEAAVGVDCADQETCPAEATDESAAHAVGIGHWFLHDWRQGPPSVFVLDLDRVVPDSVPLDCTEGGDEGCLFLTIRGDAEGEACDFVLGQTAHQFTAGCACRCPHCGSVVATGQAGRCADEGDAWRIQKLLNSSSGGIATGRCADEGDACPALQAGEPAKEIMEIREQLGPQFGLPNWAFGSGEDDREVTIRVIRRLDAEECQAPAHCPEECAASCPADGSCPAEGSYPAVGYCPAEGSCPAVAYAPVPPHAQYRDVVWAPPSPPVEFHPEQQVIQMLRETSHQLDCAAHLLESQEQYERADQLRETAAQLRAQAREAQHALHHPQPPQPAEYSEAGLWHEIRQLREELRNSRSSHEAHYRPSGMER